MKALSISSLALCLAAIPLLTSSASDKTLQNISGNVSYGATQAATSKLTRNASTSLNDNDWAKTGGGNSLATITLPDSSVIKMGADSEVQMQKFDNPGIATANFFVNGKVRFKVEHPAGAKANYTFKTSTGQIAVRGTEGDILANTQANGQPGGLQVNVYQVSDPTLPVKVTLNNGQVFTLAAGQSLVVTAAAGALVAAIGAVSNTTFAPFAQLGAPANAGSLGISTTASTTAAAAGTSAAAGGVAGTTAAAIAVGTATAVNVVSSSQKNNQSTPAPSPTPSTITVPIGVNGRPPGPSGPPPAAPTAPPGGLILPHPGTPPMPVPRGRVTPHP